MSDFGNNTRYEDVPVELVLDCPMAFPEEDTATVREYLSLLFTELWREGDRFDSKRPLGSGDWQDEVYRSLGAAGIIEVEMEKSSFKGEPDEYIRPIDYKSADKLIIRSIQSALLPNSA